MAEKNIHMSGLFITLLCILSYVSTVPIVLNSKPWKNDPRFSTSRERINLLQQCSITNSVKHRETRRFQLCNPPHEILGVPTGNTRGPLSYKLHIIGKPNIQFTLKEGDSSHNVYYENHELSFDAKVGECKEFYLTNLGDGIKDSRLIYKIHDQSRSSCNQKTLWEEKQRKINNYYPSVMPSGDDAATKVIEGLFWQIYKMVVPPIPGVEILLKSFWPKFGPSAWDKMKSKVQKQIAEADLFRVNVTSNQQLNTYRKKLVDLQETMALGSAQVESLVMGISAMFVGQEELVMFEKEVVLSSQLLPIFSTTVALFINFHVWAVSIANQYNFHEKNIALLKIRRDNHVRYAHNYVMNVYDTNMEHAYDTCDLKLNFYDCMVDVHNHIAISGIQYLSMWSASSDYDSIDSRTEDLILYSGSFGTPTLELMKSSIFHPRGEFRLLTPVFTTSMENCSKRPNDSNCLRRQNITRIYISYADKQRRISNITTFYNGKREEVDREEGNYISLEEDVVITKISVGGKGSIDYIKFHLSNEIVESFGYFGNVSDTPNVTFEMKNYYITAISVQSDNAQKVNDRDHQAKNIAVSYRRFTQNTPALD